MAWTVGAGMLGAATWAVQAESSAPPPRAARLLDAGTPVRVRVDVLGDRWLAGQVIYAPLGCTLVRLTDDERAVGAGSLRLGALRELEQREAAGARAAVTLDALRAAEPAGCARA